MAIDCVLDEHSSVIITIFRETVDSAQVEGYLVERAHALADQPPCRRVLLDLRYLKSFNIESADMNREVRLFAGFVSRLQTAQVAFVAWNEDLLALAKRYEKLMEKLPINVKVFHKLEEALDWLGLPPDYELWPKSR